MTKLTKFFTILFIFSLVGQIAAKYFAASVPFLGELAKVLPWVCAGCGAAALVFAIIVIIKEIKGDKKE